MQRIPHHLFVLAALLVGCTAVSALKSAETASYPITIAREIDVGGVRLHPSAPPAGLKTDAKFGLLLNASMNVQLLRYHPGEHTDVARAVKTPAGDYLVVITAGKGHYAPAEGAYHEKRNDLIAYRSSDGGRTWSEPSVLFPVPYSMHGFVPLIPRGTKRIYCFGTEPVPELREDRENAPIAFRFSDDDGHTWSPPTLIRPTNDPDFKGMSIQAMTETDTGTWLIGSHAAHWDPGFQRFSEWVQNKTGRLHTKQYVLRSDDRGKTWTVAPGPRPNGWFAAGYDRMDEARPLALGASRVLMLARTAEGHLWELRSEDDGLTWTKPKPTLLVHPDAPVMLFTLADKKTLIVLHHNNYNAALPHFIGPTRDQLWYSLSRDQGHTWTEPRFVVATADKNRNAQISYVDLLADGPSLHLFVSYGWKQTLHLSFLERDLEQMPTLAELEQRQSAVASQP